MENIETCCYCISIRTVGVSIGWTGVIGSAFHMCAAHYAISKSIHWAPFVLIDAKEFRNDVAILAYIYIGMCIIYLLVSLSLFWGGLTRKHKFVIPWLITIAILFIMTFLAVVIGGSICFADKETEIIGTVLFCVYFPILLLHIYLWLLVYSMYLKFRDLEYTDNNLTGPTTSVYDW